MSTLAEHFKKALGRGMRDALRPGIAYGLKKMYDGNNPGARDSYWEAEAEELLSYMKDYAKAQRAKK